MIEWRNLTWTTGSERAGTLMWASSDSVPMLTIYRLQGKSPWADAKGLEHGDIAIFHRATLAYTGHVLGAMAFIHQFQLTPEGNCHACINKDRVRD